MKITLICCAALAVALALIYARRHFVGLRKTNASSPAPGRSRRETLVAELFFGALEVVCSVFGMLFDLLGMFFGILGMFIEVAVAMISVAAYMLMFALMVAVMGFVFWALGNLGSKEGREQIQKEIQSWKQTEKRPPPITSEDAFAEELKSLPAKQVKLIAAREKSEKLAGPARDLWTRDKELMAGFAELVRLQAKPAARDDAVDKFATILEKEDAATTELRAAVEQATQAARELDDSLYLLKTSGQKFNKQVENEVLFRDAQRTLSTEREALNAVSDLLKQLPRLDPNTADLVHKLSKERDLAKDPAAQAEYARLIHQELIKSAWLRLAPDR